MLDKYAKTTVGFVTQRFERKGNRFICVGQDFIAGDQVDYEHGYGDDNALSEEERQEAGIGTSKETYQPFHMEQPLKDYYILQMWGLVEAQLHGPYKSSQARATALEKIKDEDGEEKHTYDTFELPRGTEINL